MLPPGPAGPSPTPPWDRPAWVTFDPPSVLANLERLAPGEAVLDLRSLLLERIWRQLEEEFRRRGCRGYLAERPLFSPFQSGEPEGWEKFLAPAYPADRLEGGLRAGFSLVVGHLSEAIILSNMAQAFDRRCRVLVRVRHPDLMADAGPTGVLSILELLPQLPLLELAGFFFDQPFATRQECETFGRALTRCLGETGCLMALTRAEGPWPNRLQPRRVIGTELLGVASEQAVPLTATLTLEAWGVPLTSREASVRLAVDLGTAHGLPPRLPAIVYVEHQPARVVRLEERRLVLEMASRPPAPSPWRVLLLGGTDGGGVVAPADWPDGLPLGLLETVVRTWPESFAPTGAGAILTPA
ncbi:MAG: hypothetical protein OZSIB_1303 [Candidatus Ozemobacter sibiricus]|uniref:Uncharacterized protein n=1 Tax=Candidatus Ozemobacter sibiricus TaxID=2268124 RepID=A0A367ZMK2_9BACT|nr:MAG: hypothetical protein OZSIB_1303 [Candidatus Ozemobacter sibiricus]